MGRVAHRAQLLPERRAQRDHPRPQDLLLEIEEDPVGVAVRLDERRAGGLARGVQHPRQPAVGDRDLAAQVEHPVEPGEVHAQRALARGRGG